jgi:hypothetical protein
VVVGVTLFIGVDTASLVTRSCFIKPTSLSSVFKYKATVNLLLAISESG